MRDSSHKFASDPSSSEELVEVYRTELESDEDTREALAILHYRGGKRKSFTWKAFSRAIDRLGIAKPKIEMIHRQHRVFA